MGIITVTLNPAIDLGGITPCVEPVRKVRLRDQTVEPGGGGINVARVVATLGGKAMALYLAGGATGRLYGDLVEATGIGHRAFPITGATRISMAVHEEVSSRDYRFVAEGPLVSAAEAGALLDAIDPKPEDIVVLSGSLPRGLSADHYARITAALAPSGCRVVLDTSGEALAAAVRDGGLFAIKPNREELEELVGTSLADDGALTVAAQRLIADGAAEHALVTLGSDGVLWASQNGCLRLGAVAVEARSAVGAGDSFVGGLVHGIASGLAMDHAIRLGVAAGAATLLTPGTALCKAVDVERLLPRVGSFM